MPKVSIIVPVFNVEKYISEMIESLIHQTMKDIEVILVDDGSPDKSGEICDAYASEDARIKVIHKANGGVSAARNDGLKLAFGEWVIFCDSDDWLELDAMEKLLKAAERNGADIAFGDANLAYGSVIKANPLYRTSFIADNKEAIDHLVAAVCSRNYCFDPPEAGPGNGGYGGPWNKLVKRQLIVDNNISFDVRVKGHFDDILYIARIYACAKKIVYINKPVYNYRQLDNSIAHASAYKGNLLEINAAIFQSWQEFIHEYGADGQYQLPIYANVIRRFKSTLGPYFFNKKNPKSFGQQLRELREVMDQEPYATAIKEAEQGKLHNTYDDLVRKAARKHSPFAIYLVYKMSIVAKKRRRKNNSGI